MTERFAPANRARLSRRALLGACGRAAIGVAGLALVGCSGDGSDDSVGLETPPWGYSAGNGPERWAEFSPAYAACSAGAGQSPVDIAGYQVSDDPPPTFAYEGRSTHLEHLATTVHVRFAGRNLLMLAEGDYLLRQIHWHTPSEHQIDGRSFPMEMHLVHGRGSGEFAVIGVFYELGAADEPLQRLIDSVPPGATGATDDVDLSAEEFMPGDAACFAYHGSLTTPPCSEVVSWLLMRERRTLSEAQLAALRGLTSGDNNRPVQPLNDRPIRLLGG